MSQSHPTLRPVVSGLGYALLAASFLLIIVFLVAFWRDILGGAERDAHQGKDEDAGTGYAPGSPDSQGRPAGWVGPSAPEGAPGSSRSPLSRFGGPATLGRSFRIRTNPLANLGGGKQGGAADVGDPGAHTSPQDVLSLQQRQQAGDFAFGFDNPMARGGGGGMGMGMGSDGGLAHSAVHFQHSPRPSSMGRTQTRCGLRDARTLLQPMGCRTPLPLDLCGEQRLSPHSRVCCVWGRVV
jgi:hypothetical protein